MLDHIGIAVSDNAVGASLSARALTPRGRGTDPMMQLPHSTPRAAAERAALRRAARRALAVIAKSALTGRLAHMTFTRRQTRAHLRT